MAWAMKVVPSNCAVPWSSFRETLRRSWCVVNASVLVAFIGTRIETCWGPVTACLSFHFVRTNNSVFPSCI